MNKKVKSFKHTVFLSEQHNQKLQQVFEVLSFGLETGPLSLLPLMIHRLKSSQNSGVSGLYCCYRNTLLIQSQF